METRVCQTRAAFYTIDHGMRLPKLLKLIGEYVFHGQSRVDYISSRPVALNDQCESSVTEILKPELVRVHMSSYLISAAGSSALYHEFPARIRTATFE